MLSKEDARTIIGIVGNIISLVLFLSPIQAFYRIWKRKSVEEYSPVPYLATLANCGLWTLYGLPMVHPHSTLVVTINGLGFLIEVVFLSLFFVFSDSKKRQIVVAVVAAEGFCLAVLAVLVLTLAHTILLRSIIVGSIATTANVLMYASPLSVMKLVITTRSVEYMPFFLSLFSFLNAVCWLSYSLIQFDLFLMIPNAMGTIFGLAQLILYTVFYKSTQQIMATKRAQAHPQVSLTETSTRP